MAELLPGEVQWTTRCTAEERAAFGRIRIRVDDTKMQRVAEPALGTVLQRLDIIYRRLGGVTRRPREDIEKYRVLDVA